MKLLQIDRGWGESTETHLLPFLHLTTDHERYFWNIGLAFGWLKVSYSIHVFFTFSFALLKFVLLCCFTWFFLAMLVAGIPFLFTAWLIDSLVRYLDVEAREKHLNRQWLNMNDTEYDDQL